MGIGVEEGCPQRKVLSQVQGLPPWSREKCGKVGFGVGAGGRLCGEQRKAEDLGGLNKVFLFYQLLVRSLVANEEFTTSWGRMNQGLGETLVAVSQPQ